jgi:hypothetical protein
MDSGKQKLKLEENIAAVRFAEFLSRRQTNGSSRYDPSRRGSPTGSTSAGCRSHATNRVEGNKVWRVPR